MKNIPEKRIKKGPWLTEELSRLQKTDGKQNK